MDHYNLPLEHEDKRGSRISVAFVGFEPADEESFTRFFQAERPGLRKYVAAIQADKAGCDIVMVNYDNPGALAVRDALISAKPSISVVAVSRGPLLEPPLYHIRGMLFAARVLTTLDKVSLPDPKLVSANSQGDSECQSTTAELPKPDLTGALRPNISEGLSTTASPAAFGISSVTPTEPVAIEGYRALVVDDSIAIQKSLEINLATLTQIGRIDFADNGESAIAKAESVHYDLIFLDVMMPGIDGYETCSRLRKKAEYKKTPIIMVSGKTSPLDEVKGVMAGCTTYLTKPVQPEAFQKLSIRVLAWLENQQKSQ